MGNLPLIMVVDDEKIIADSLKEMIDSTKKYDVVAAYSAKEALDTLKKNKGFLGMGKNKIRLIFLDIKMPEMDGLQFLEKLRDEYEKSIGVIIVSAWSDEEKWLVAASEYVAGYIIKPFKREIILKALNRFFEGQSTDMSAEIMQTFLQKDFVVKKDGEGQ